MSIVQFYFRKYSSSVFKKPDHNSIDPVTVNSSGECADGKTTTQTSATVSRIKIHSNGAFLIQPDELGPPQKLSTCCGTVLHCTITP
jgi:hypothetical protein